MANITVTQAIRKVYLWVCTNCNKENVELELPKGLFLHCNKCGRIHRTGKLNYE